MACACSERPQTRRAVRHVAPFKFVNNFGLPKLFTKLAVSYIKRPFYSEAKNRLRFFVAGLYLPKSLCVDFGK